MIRLSLSANFGCRASVSVCKMMSFFFGSFIVANALETSSKDRTRFRLGSSSINLSKFSRSRLLKLNTRKSSRVCTSWAIKRRSVDLPTPGLPISRMLVNCLNLFSVMMSSTNRRGLCHWAILDFSKSSGPLYFGVAPPRAYRTSSQLVIVYYSSVGSCCATRTSWPQAGASIFRNIAGPYRLGRVAFLANPNGPQTLPFAQSWQPGDGRIGYTMLCGRPADSFHDSLPGGS